MPTITRGSSHDGCRTGCASGGAIHKGAASPSIRLTGRAWSAVAVIVSRSPIIVTAFGIEPARMSLGSVERWNQRECTPQKHGGRQIPFHSVDPLQVVEANYHSLLKNQPFAATKSRRPGPRTGEIMKRLICAVAALSAFATVSADARVWGRPSGWEVWDSEDTCFTAREFEGPGSTLMLIGIKANGDQFLSFANYGWSARVDDHYRLRYTVNGRSYSDVPAIGFGSGGRRGFVTPTSDELLRDIEAGNAIQVHFQDGTLVDQLQLDGTSAAMALVRHCLATVRPRAERERRDRERLQHIPTDPFAGRTPPAPPVPTRPLLPIDQLPGDTPRPVAGARSSSAPPLPHPHQPINRSNEQPAQDQPQPQ